MSVSVQGALDNLVGQFSSALDCYRELVQNAIDAGSPSVDVWTEFTPSEDSSGGTIAVHIDDFGEGMDEAIIDSQLTRLFSSTKENDLTKIGKFGIGFVSVFALEPKAVLIHTGRGGEYWEVLFNEDRSFSKAPIDTPMEGTQITLFLEGDDHRYRELSDATRATLKKWCRFSETEIYFEDRSDPDSKGPAPINEVFKADGDLEVTVEYPGTIISMARTDSPKYGFFNRGLTLLETADNEEAVGKHHGRFEHIGFNIKSRYLEHTLSRETIVRDENYQKALDLLLEVADGPLMQKLVAHIEDITGKSSWSRADRDDYVRAMRMLNSESLTALNRYAGAKLFRTIGGGSVSLDSLWKTFDEYGRVLVSPRASDLTDFLGEEKIPVLLGGAGLRPLRNLLGRYLLAQEERTIRWHVDYAKALVKSLWAPEEESFRERTSSALMRSICDPHGVFLSVNIIEDPDPALAALLGAVQKVLREIGARYDAVLPCRLEVPEIDPPMFLTGRRIARLMARPIAPRPAQSLEEEREIREQREKRKKKGVAAINVDHPHVRYLTQLPPGLYDFAIYGLAKSMLLQRDELLTADADLISACQKEAM